MNFLNPLGLLGLISLPVIVGLHLYRERSRRVVVSSLNLWSFLDIQLRGSKSRYLRITRLLLLDLLIAALLSLALAHPELKVPFFFDPREHVIILIDDSSSMFATDVFPTRFGMAITEIQALLNEQKPNNVVSVLTFGGEVSCVGDSREIKIQTLSSRVGNLQAGDVDEDILSAMSLGYSMISDLIPVEFHIFTDGAFEEPKFSNLPHSIQWHFYGQNSGNQAITSLNISEVSMNNHQVFTNIANFSDDQIILEATFQADGIEVARVPVALTPQAVVPQIWNVTGQPGIISVSLSGTDSFQLDDFASLGRISDRLIRVVLVSENPAPVDRAILAIPNVELQVYQPTEFLPGMDYDLLIFRGYLPVSLPAGNILVLDPPLDSNTLRIEGKFPISNQPAFDDVDLLKGVDFNGIRWGSAWAIEDWQDQFSPVLWSGEIPLLLTGKINLSDLIVFLPVLEEGNITKHPLFPILISNVMLASGGYTFPSQVELGTEIHLPPMEKYPMIQIINPLGETNSVLQLDPGIYTETRVPGVYHIEITDLDGDTEISAIGVNAGSLSESRIAPRAWVNDIQASVEIESGPVVREIDISPWLLGIALVLISLEVLLAWR
jgi:hypothetical protein